jgi:MFS transporter, BCD family, chlorophyll transporter
MKAIGVAIAVSGGLRDVVSHLALSGKLGPALADPSTGYQFVYHLEIVLLFASLIAIGPLVRRAEKWDDKVSDKGMAHGLKELAV